MVNESGSRNKVPWTNAQGSVWSMDILHTERGVMVKMKMKPRSALAEPRTREITLYTREMRWLLNPEYLPLKG